MSSRKFKLNDSTAQICILSINQANHKFLISVYLTVKPVMVFILCLYVRATVLLAASYANIRHIVAHTHKRNFMFCRIQPRNDINDGKRPNDWHSSAKLNMLGGVFGAPDDCQTNGIRTKFIMRVLLCVCVCVCVTKSIWQSSFDVSYKNMALFHSRNWRSANNTGEPK